jgi:serine/threonine protein kinase
MAGGLGGHLLNVEPSRSYPRPRENLATGAILLQRYRVQAEVGRGAMSVVHAGFDIALELPVAIKALRRSAATNAAASERFLAEARMLARVRHPSILRVTDYGLLEDGRPFMVMEFLRGTTLHALLARTGKLDWARAKPLLLSTCAALQAVHEARIVHRDVKPQNLFVLDEGLPTERVKVLDFGLANDPRAPMTGPGLGLRSGEYLLLGTPGFMAPEQVTDAEVDARADVYALGVTLFLMLTGRLPFISEHPVRQMAEHMYVPPPRPRSLEPSIPPAVESLVLRALAKDPAQRIASMQAFCSEADAIPIEASGDEYPVLLSMQAILDDVAAPEPVDDDRPTPLVLEPTAPHPA